MPLCPQLHPGPPFGTSPLRLSDAGKPRPTDEADLGARAALSCSPLEHLALPLLSSPPRGPRDRPQSVVQPGLVAGTGQMALQSTVWFSLRSRLVWSLALGPVGLI